MNWKNAVAFAMAGIVTFGAVTPVFAATRSKSAMHRRGDGRTKHARMHRSSSWYGDRFGPAARSYAHLPDAHAPGSWHINQNGLPYRVPDDCAYPIGYDSGGAAIFQMFGCHLP